MPGSAVQLNERLALLSRHTRHLRELVPRVSSTATLERDLSLHNNVMYSLHVVCRSVADISRDLPEQLGAFDTSMLRDLRGLADLGDSLLQEITLGRYGHVLNALERLDVVEQFTAVVAELAGVDTASP